MHRELAATWVAADEIPNQMTNIKLSEKSTSTNRGSPSGGTKHALSKLLEQQEERYESDETSQKNKWSAAVPDRYMRDTNKNSDFGGCQCIAAFTSTNEY